jgi:hypothetical protein
MISIQNFSKIYRRRSYVPIQLKWAIGRYLKREVLGEVKEVIEDVVVVVIRRTF